jgi:glutathione synthase/RimK-type ligase-like ATP-grasp enzyme
VSAADEARTRALIDAEDVLLQPFLPSILTDGEVSLIVIDGTVTHAVRKVAAAGEFRVQDDHGGRVLAHTPAPDEIAVAEQAIAACRPHPVYARVDLVRMPDGVPAIMELELVEPELFFRFAPHAASRLAAAVAALLS